MSILTFAALYLTASFALALVLGRVFDAVRAAEQAADEFEHEHTDWKGR